MHPVQNCATELMNISPRTDRSNAALKRRGNPAARWRAGFSISKSEVHAMGWLSAPSTRLSAAPRAVGYGDKAAAERGRDQLRRLYNTKRWLDPETGVRRRVITHDNTECQMRETLLIGECHAPNSSVVDQIKSHRGNLVLFWDEANLQALCKKCHDREKQRMDNAAALPGGGKSL